MSDNRTFSPAEMLSARAHAKQTGKALVRDDEGVLVMTWHPLARAVTVTDLLETQDEATGESEREKRFRDQHERETLALMEE